MQPNQFSNPTTVAEALDRINYLPNASITIAAFLTMRIKQPLFLKNNPNINKTTLAQTLTEIIGVPLVRLQYYKKIDANQTLYN